MPFQVLNQPLHGIRDVRGTVFNQQRYSLHDGPGIRTTVFLKGCPARCWWCHNPESYLASPQMAYTESRCIHCDACLLSCHNGLKLRDVCILCGDCARACPTDARTLVGREMTSGEVVIDVMRDRMFFESSGGGVTLSGGEPLCQPEFVKALLTQFQGLEIRTAVDTAGFCPTGALLDVAPLVDLFLFDLKCIDPDKHLRGTGMDNRGVLDNLARLSAVHANIWIRIPVVLGFNDTVQEMDAIARVAADSGAHEVWLLPYHAGWVTKRERFGLESVDAAPLSFPPAVLLREFALIFQGYGLKTTIGGAHER